MDGACWVCFCCRHSPVKDMNVRIFWVRAMKCMFAQTRPRFILSSERVYLGNGVWTHFNSKGKIPFTGKFPQRRIEPVTLWTASPNISSYYFTLCNSTAGWKEANPKAPWPPHLRSTWASSCEHQRHAWGPQCLGRSRTGPAAEGRPAQDAPAGQSPACQTAIKIRSHRFLSFKECLLTICNFR